MRNSNTFKSNVLGNDSGGQAPMRSKDVFKEKPLAAKVQRTSYQDSNIFGYKMGDNATVQPSATHESRSMRERNNPTFASRVFHEGEME